LPSDAPWSWTSLNSRFIFHVNAAAMLVKFESLSLRLLSSLPRLQLPINAIVRQRLFNCYFLLYSACYLAYVKRPVFKRTLAKCPRRRSLMGCPKILVIFM